MRSLLVTRKESIPCKDLDREGFTMSVVYVRSHRLYGRRIRLRLFFLVGAEFLRENLFQFCHRQRNGNSLFFKSLFSLKVRVGGVRDGHL